MHNGKIRSALLRNAFFGATLGAAVFGTAAEASRSLWTTIDPPTGTKTTPTAITGHNMIVGRYWDSNGRHGFMRTPDGTFTSFDEPDSTGATNPAGANYSGDIVGDFFGQDGTYGFLRKADGTFSAFLYNHSDTYFRAINGNGTIAGYTDNGIVFSAFLRTPDGTVTPILQGASAVAVAINKSGVVAGYTVGTWHGFVRERRGRTTQFDPPGSYLTNALAINDSGTITGLFIDPSGTHGFVRQPDGTITTFDAPGAIAGTLSNAIDNNGNIAGCAMVSQTNSHGFVRDASGAFHTVDEPGANSTCIAAIGPRGRLIGQYFGGSGVQHGFLAAPGVWQQ